MCAPSYTPPTLNIDNTTPEYQSPASTIRRSLSYDVWTIGVKTRLMAHFTSCSPIPASCNAPLFAIWHPRDTAVGDMAPVETTRYDEVGPPPAPASISAPIPPPPPVCGVVLSAAPPGGESAAAAAKLPPTPGGRGVGGISSVRVPKEAFPSLISIPPTADLPTG